MDSNVCVLCILISISHTKGATFGLVCIKNWTFHLNTTHYNELYNTVTQWISMYMFWVFIVHVFALETNGCCFIEELLLNSYFAKVIAMVTQCACEYVWYDAWYVTPVVVFLFANTCSHFHIWPGNIINSFAMQPIRNIVNDKWIR